MTSKETNDSSTRCYYHKLSVQKLIEEQSKNEGKEKKNDRLPEQRIDLLRPKGQYQQKGEMGNSEVRKQQKKNKFQGPPRLKLLTGMTETRSACTVASFGQRQQSSLGDDWIQLLQVGACCMLRREQKSQTIHL